METKYFQSKYNEFHRQAWKGIIKELGANVYDVFVPCELAVILGGYFENPTAFKGIKTLVFYKTDFEDDGSASYKQQYDTWALFEKRKYEVWVQMLKSYFDETVDLTGLTPKDAAERIRETVEAN
jgi:hypothetical protein